MKKIPPASSELRTGLCSELCFMCWLLNSPRLTNHDNEEEDESGGSSLSVTCCALHTEMTAVPSPIWKLASESPNLLGESLEFSPLPKSCKPRAAELQLALAPRATNLGSPFPRTQQAAGTPCQGCTETFVWEGGEDPVITRDHQITRASP